MSAAREGGFRVSGIRNAIVVDGHVLRAWRRSRGWDAPEMAHQLRKAAQTAHIPTLDSLVNMVYRWEREGLSTERYQLLYARALGIDPDDLPAGPEKASGNDCLAMPEAPDPEGESATPAALSLAVMIGARLKAERKARLWSARKMAEMLRSAADNPDSIPHIISIMRMIRQWEKGAHLLSEDYRFLYCKAFGMSEEEVFGLLLGEASPQGASQDGHMVISGPEDARGAAILDEEEVERREFLKFAGGMATVPLIADMDRARRELDKALKAETSLYDVEEWERVALEYSSTVGRVPLMQVLPGLLTDLEEAQHRLRNSRGSLRGRMTRACALLSALAAIAFLNVGDSEGANRHWRTAMRAADLAHDREVQSLIRGRRAVFSMYDRRTPPSSILSLAKDSIDIADGTPCAGVASGYAARAQVLALLGQHDESIQTLRELGDIFPRLPESTASDRISQWGWSEQRLRHVESFAYSYAGRLDDATESQEAALALYPKDGYQGRTQVELYKSICIIRGGDPTEGARHAVRTIQALPASYQGDAVVRRTAAQMLTVVPGGASGLPAVSEARELLMLGEGLS